MINSKIIRFWGAIDVIYVIWRVVTDIYESRIPFYNTFKDVIDVSVSFEHWLIFLGSMLTSLVFLTIVISGPLMIFHSKIGVYLSIVQAPFRLLLLLPPTMFFLKVIGDRFHFHILIVLFVIIFVELLKIYTQVNWLKNKGNAH